MIRSVKNHLFIIFGSIVILSVLFSSEALSWGSATHAYIADQLGKRSGSKNNNEIYGSMAPDLFNFSRLDSNLQALFADQTHTAFMKAWSKAKSSLSKAGAFGLVSHNDSWGADFTAHHCGLTFGGGSGYVVSKAELLKPSVLAQLEPLTPPGYSRDSLDALASEISHDLIECSVDLLIKELDPSIGQKVFFSSLLRSSEFPALLNNAYAKDMARMTGMTYRQVTGIISSSETAFKKTMIRFGQALMLDTDTALELLSEELAGIAVSMLQRYGIELPSGADLAGLVRSGIDESMNLCAADFAGEIAATIGFVGQKMNASRVVY